MAQKYLDRIQGLHQLKLEHNEEKLRRWKREQALFMQRWPEFFLDGDPWLGPNLSAESEYFSV
mgnify:FL=1